MRGGTLREAMENWLELSTNRYPGNGIIVGLDGSGKNLVQIYWVMDKDELRVRILENEGGRVSYGYPLQRIHTTMADKPCRGSDSIFLSVVGNGAQTDDILRSDLPRNQALSGVMKEGKWTYESDKPNYTPRITATAYWAWNDFPLAQMSILSKSLLGDGCNRNLFELNQLGSGFGYCIHTYMDDGDPLPPFHGEPYLVPLDGGIEEIADYYWKTLDEKRRVALAVKFIPEQGDSPVVKIINKY